MDEDTAALNIKAHMAT